MSLKTDFEYFLHYKLPKIELANKVYLFNLDKANYIIFKKENDEYKMYIGYDIGTVVIKFDSSKAAKHISFKPHKHE